VEQDAAFACNGAIHLQEPLAAALALLQTNPYLLF
jgi:hypothetical protein